jgi:hypothetical protein
MINTIQLEELLLLQETHALLENAFGYSNYKDEDEEEDDDDEDVDEDDEFDDEDEEEEDED